jgi:site-specific recombinase XerD
MQTEKMFNLPMRNVASRQSEQGIKSKDGIKYLNTVQVNLLRRVAKEKGDLALARGNKGGVREWMLIDLLSSTGVRASEAANIRCGDLNIGYAESSIFIRCGKGRCSRMVYISSALRRHLKAYLRWKQGQGEPMGEDDHLFCGQKGYWTRQAVANIVRKYLKQLGFYKKGMAAHTLRHTYGMLLYRQEGNLRTVQKQLGHSSISTTQIYSDVMESDIMRQVNGLWNYYD